MAEYGRVDISHNSEDEEEEQSPHSMSLLCGGGGGSGGGGGGMSATRSRRMMRNDNSSGGGGGSGSGEMGEIVRKPRGRPPGSKNKPKPPIVITRDNEAALKPVVLEICAGSDVVEQVVEYARRRHVGLSVLSGCGTVSSVTLRHPMAHAPTISLHGPLNIVCLSGTYLGPTATSSVPQSSSSSSFSVSLAGSQGQVFGGIIAGKVTAQTPVVVVAATFASPSYQRLPGGGGAGEEEEEEEGEEGHNSNSSNKKNSTVGGGGESGGGGGGVSSSGVAAPPGMYSNNVGGRQTGGGGGLNGPMSPDVLHWGASSASRPHPY